MQSSSVASPAASRRPPPMATDPLTAALLAARRLALGLAAWSPGSPHHADACERAGHDMALVVAGIDTCLLQPPRSSTPKSKPGAADIPTGGTTSPASLVPPYSPALLPRLRRLHLAKNQLPRQLDALLQEQPSGGHSTTLRRVLDALVAVDADLDSLRTAASTSSAASAETQPPQQQQQQPLSILEARVSRGAVDSISANGPSSSSDTLSRNSNASAKPHGAGSKPKTRRVAHQSTVGPDPGTSDSRHRDPTHQAQHHQHRQHRPGPTVNHNIADAGYGNAATNPPITPKRASLPSSSSSASSTNSGSAQFLILQTQSSAQSPSLPQPYQHREHEQPQQPQLHLEEQQLVLQEQQQPPASRRRSVQRRDPIAPKHTSTDFRSLLDDQSGPMAAIVGQHSISQYENLQMQSTDAEQSQDSESVETDAIAVQDADSSVTVSGQHHLELSSDPLPIANAPSIARPPSHSSSASSLSDMDSRVGKLPVAGSLDVAQPPGNNTPFMPQHNQSSQSTEINSNDSHPSPLIAPAVAPTAAATAETSPLKGQSMSIFLKFDTMVRKVDCMPGLCVFTLRHYFKTAFPSADLESCDIFIKHAVHGEMYLLEHMSDVADGSLLQLMPHTPPSAASNIDLQLQSILHILQTRPMAPLPLKSPSRQIVPNNEHPQQQSVQYADHDTDLHESGRHHQPNISAPSPDHTPRRTGSSSTLYLTPSASVSAHSELSMAYAQPSALSTASSLANADIQHTNQMEGTSCKLASMSFTSALSIDTTGTARPSVATDAPVPSSHSVTLSDALGQIAAVRELHSNMCSAVSILKSSFSASLKECSHLLSKAVKAQDHAALARLPVQSSLDAISDTSEQFEQRINAFRAMLDMLRMDVTRGARLTDTEVAHVRRGIDTLGSDITLFAESIGSAKAKCKVTWEMELQRIVDEQAFLKDQEAFGTDLAHTHADLADLLVDIENVTAFQSAALQHHQPSHSQQSHHHHHDSRHHHHHNHHSHLSHRSHKNDQCNAAPFAALQPQSRVVLDVLPASIAKSVGMDRVLSELKFKSESLLHDTDKRLMALEHLALARPLIHAARTSANPFEMELSAFVKSGSLRPTTGGGIGGVDAKRQATDARLIKSIVAERHTT